MSALKDQISSIVTRYSAEKIQRRFLLATLRRPGFALHPQAPRRASSLVLGAVEASADVGRGRVQTAVRAAAAIEILMAACFMFDHVADGEVSPDDNVTESEELALAIGMLSCAHAEIAELMHTQGMQSSAAGHVFANFVGACAGQFLDAHLQRGASYDLAKSLEMTSLKAGSLGRVAAELGSRICTHDQAVIHTCSDFGFHLFTYGQVIDDIRDSCHQQGAASDLEAGKKTVPLAFLLGSTAFGRNSGGNLQLTQDSFRNSGAFVATQLLAESILNQAKDCLTNLRQKGRRVSRFTRLADSLEQVSRSFDVVSD